MTRTPPKPSLNYLRLTAIAQDVENFVTKHEDRLSEADLSKSHDLHAQLRGMAALIDQEDPGRFINVVNDTAIDWYVCLY